MPIYEYKCKKCKKEFEALQRMSDTKAECPHCKSEETERLLSKFSGSVEQKGSCAGPGST